ncbi:MAG: hypothetical protein RL264_633, partial [Bacteroidota bacterium]
MVAILVTQVSLIAQVVSPFNIRYQTNSKGNIVILSNVAITCNSSNSNCGTYQQQLPPTGNHNQDGSITQDYIDIDSDAGTWMSSSDSMSLANCSEILWAGLYWQARIQSSTTNYAIRNRVKMKVNNGAYQDLAADDIYDLTTIPTNQNFAMPGYFCFKNVTSLLSSSNGKARITVANVVSQTGVNNLFGSWSLVVVYKNVFQNMRNLTVFDGVSYVSNVNNLDIPISGFTTPSTGPVTFDLGIVAMEGDRNIPGDRLQFNGNGSFLDIPDANRSANDFFNSSITNYGVITPFRNPSYNNQLGFDAGMFSPNNSTLNYIGNSATAATVRVVTSQDAILPRVITSAIDIYEPDLRANVRVSDIDGGTIDPGDILEYTLVGKNIGSDLSINTYLENTIDDRVDFVPGSISVTFGPNSGAKTDATGDDQGEYNSTTRKIRVRIGTGANGTNGGQVQSSPSGADSTVVKFRVKVKDECMMFQCNPTIYNVAYIYGKGNISGNNYNNNGLSDTYNSQGCPVTLSNALTINVTGCPTPTINYPTTCANSSLQLSTTYSANATYNWSGPNGFTSTVHNPVINPATSLNSGIYTLTISFASLTCSLTLSKLVVIRPLPTITQGTLNNVTCFGLNNGSVQVSASGATSPYSYSWSNGATTSSISNLGPGTYTVTVTDFYGCQRTASYTITEPPLLVATASITSNYNGRNISCNGAADGSATVAYSGGTSPYTVLWSNSATTQNISNLGPGIYTATVTDARGCVRSSAVTLTQPSAVVLTESHTDVSCFGGANGSINLNFSGGTSPYSYLWSNGATTQNLSNLSAGTYSVTAKDVNNCSRFLSITITQPTQLAVSRTSVDINCFGQNTGSIDVSVSGGTPNYTYAWSNGATVQDLSNLAAGIYSLTVTDSKGCQQVLSTTLTQPSAALSTNLSGTNLTCNANSSGVVNSSTTGGTPNYSYSWSNGATTQNLVNVAAGTYTLTITDLKGCQQVASQTITQPTVLNLGTTSTNVTCFGLANGSITSNVSGGTSPYSYSWNNGASTANLSNLAPGTYTLTLTDFNGCVRTRNVTITQPIAPLDVTAVRTNINCFGQNNGTITLTVTGGTTPYSYLWSNGSTTKDLSGLSSGVYSVIVTDARGCQSSTSVTITEPSSPISVSLSGIDLTCFGNFSGSITSSVSGGTAPYSYAWSNGATTSDLSGLAAGVYSLTLTDFRSCQQVVAVTISEPPAMVLNENVVNISCFGLSDGSISTNLVGGISPYTYSWSNGSTVSDLNNLFAGSYILSVTDSKGCQIIDTFSIIQPLLPLSLSVTKTNISCHGLTTGVINLTASGGTPTYTYAWSNGAFSEDLVSIGAGVYSVTVTDSRGCQETISETITEPAVLDVVLTGNNLTCNGNGSGSITSAVSGGTPNYTYQWSTFATTPSISNLTIGTYTLTVTDAAGCQKVASQTITQPAVIALSDVRTPVSCRFG